jgi:cellulose synthase (UDP-forming)
VLLIAPFIYFLTGVTPLAGYTSAFYLHAVPFLFVLQLALLVTTWGVRTGKASAFELALAPLQLRALWHVLRRRASPPPFAQEAHRRGLHLVVPQVTLIALTVAGLLLACWRVFVQGQGQELPALIVNGAWSVFNLGALLAPVRAALWRPDATPQPVAATDGMIA